MRIKPWLTFITGITIGVSAAALQAYFQVQPPEAFGICLLGHPSMMVKWLMNHTMGTHLAIVPAFVAFPSLLVVGVFIGSYVSAYMDRKNIELEWRAGPVRNRYMAALYGFLVVNFGLLWGSCPIRTGLLIAYGNVMAVIALFSIAAGVILACSYIRLRVKVSYK